MKQLDYQQLKDLIDQKAHYVLVDVREADELEFGTLPTAHHIPLAEIVPALEMNAQEFKEKYGFEKITKEDNLILYCRTNNRSSMAAHFAENLGFNVSVYMGGIWEWSEHDESVERYGPAP